MGVAVDIDVTYAFDPNTYRHTVNGHECVLHCHHYMSLTTKLAEKYAEHGGIDALVTSAEDSMRPLFDDYFEKHGITDANQRLAVGAEYYRLFGLGLMEIEGTADGGSVTLKRSHVDEGWVQKWGNYDKPVNHFTRGFAAAVFGAAFDKPARSYSAEETESLAMGADQGRITVTAA